MGNEISKVCSCKNDNSTTDNECNTVFPNSNMELKKGALNETLDDNFNSISVKNTQQIYDSQKSKSKIGNKEQETSLYSGSLASTIPKADDKFSPKLDPEKKSNNLNLGVIPEEFKESTIEDNIIIYSDGSKYKGTIDQNKRSGKGILFHDLNTIYDGEWLNDLYHGHGVLYLKNLNIYEGWFAAGKREGKGTEYSQGKNYYYSGEWKNDLKCGVGEEKYSDGSVYKGIFIDGKKNSKGQFFLEQGAFYEGEFVDDYIEGYGTFKWSKDKVYSGQWRKNALNGFGTFTNKGKVFKGNFVDDKKQGLGINIYSNNSYLISNYDEDRMLGIAILYNSKSGKETIYHVDKDNNKNMVVDQVEIMEIKNKQEYLDQINYVSSLQRKGIIPF